MTEAFDSPEGAVPLASKHFPFPLIEQLERFERLEHVP
jgi:hypothetical protein